MGPAFVLSVAASLYVLFWPYPSGSGGVPGADKVAHALLFALLAATARLRFGPVLAVLAGVLAYAAASEVVQALALRRRSGDLLDLVADVVGVALGWLLVARVGARRPGRSG